MAKIPKLPIKVEDLGLTVKELRFVGEYCTNNFDAIAALKAAKIISEDTSATEARLLGMEMINRSNVSTAVNRFLSSELDPYRDKLSYQILSIMRSRMDYDPSTFFNPDGTAKELDKIPMQYRQVIDAVEVKHYGKDGNVLETVYKLADRAQAIKSLTDLLNRKNGGDDEVAMNTMSRSRLDEIFKAGMVAGAVVEKGKKAQALPAEQGAVSAKDYIKDLKASIKAQVVADAEED